MPTERAPLRGQFNRRGDRLYVFHEWSPYLTIMDPFSLVITKRIFVGPGVGFIKVDTNTDKVYLGKKYGGEVAVYDPIEIYDPYSYNPAEVIKVGGGVSYMTMEGEENYLYLLIPGKKSLQMINPVNKRVVADIDVGDDPYWVVVMGER